MAWMEVGNVELMSVLGCLVVSGENISRQVHLIKLSKQASASRPYLASKTDMININDCKLFQQ
jgi:hypothetical protein